MRHWKVVSFILGLSLTFAIGCGNKQQAQAAAPGGGGRPPAPVVVAPVEQRDVPVQLNGIGNAEAYQIVQIKSQVNGQIESVHFREGQDVRRGELLFTLDKRPFQADLERAIGVMQRDEAQAANSAAQAARFNTLEQQGVIAHQLAEQQRAQAKADAAAVNSDRAAVNAARVQLQYTEIRAPLDARAGALLVNNGNLVKANDVPLVQLNQITPLYVTFSVPETYINEVRRYAPRKPKVEASPKGTKSAKPEVGYLTFIDNGVDTQTGTVKLKATFPNQGRVLLPGEYVDVVLNLSVEKNAVVVPTKAVQSGQQGDYVYVVNQQDVAEVRPVVQAGTYQGLTIVKQGLKPGERVIVEGQLRVAPNSKVAVQSTAPAGAPAKSSAPGQSGGGL